MPPQHPPGSEGSRRDGCGTRGQNRCPGAAAGPGRASRSITPSRRLACGDLAGGPPPTGTWTIGSAAVTREALHPLGNAAPVRGRCTQSGGLQCQPMGCTTPSATSANADWPHATTTWTPTCPARGPPIPHAGRLSRTWAGLPRLGTAGPRADEKAAPKHAKHEPQQHDTSYNPTCEPPRLEGATGPVGPVGPARPCRASDRPLRAAGSRRAYCRSDSSRFARTTMPMRSTIASSTQLPSSAARRGCTGASSKRRSKPRIARHRGMSSSW